MPEIAPDQFFDVDVRVGVVKEVKPFPEARKPAYQIWVDFGEAYGVKKTSAQVTVHYTPEMLVGRKVMGWVNAPVRQIGPFMSEFLILGVQDEAGAVCLLNVDKDVPIGGRMA
ncbi:MAG: tRNA-binding protein [Alphaproteobacteria bacterium]|nr:MAG: tRNA-binding protein [Alphaproteobacteria bacterium]